MHAKLILFSFYLLQLYYLRYKLQLNKHLFRIPKPNTQFSVIWKLLMKRALEMTNI